MIRFGFQHLEYLYVAGFILVPVILFILMSYWRQARLRKLGDEPLVRAQIQGYVPGRQTLKFIFVAVAFVAAVIGWANPRKADKVEEVQRKGIEVMVALDVSKSMLATDVQPDRLTRAKQLIERLMSKLQNDRVGLVIFAGRAYLQVPLTVDYATVRMMLQNVSPASVPTQGTVIAEAIDLATKSFSQKERKYKSLIIISDGEDHDEQALDKIKAATDAGIIVHTVGIGSPQGTTITDPDTHSIKLDEKGQPVVSKLNEEELKNLAAAGHGTYTLLGNADNAADKLESELEKMEQEKPWCSICQYLQELLPALSVTRLLPATGRLAHTRRTPQ